MELEWMHQIDPQFILACMSALLMLTFRWRRSYWIEFRQHPKSALKMLVIWGVVMLLLLRLFWQLKPAYFG